MRILVFNVGSSTVKFSLLDALDEKRIANGLFDRLGSPDSTLKDDTGWQRKAPGADVCQAVQIVFERLEDRDLATTIGGVGHRVVHGGEKFQSAVRIDRTVIDKIEALSRLAPLHNPQNLRGIKAAQHAWPKKPHVAVFDTAFHQTLAPSAFLYPLPMDLHTNHGIRRYGFHGSSHQYVAEQAALRLGRDDLGLVTAHLGNGCSLAAVQSGRSVDTTMGMTPLEGLVMGTRSGSIDPGALPAIAEARDLDLCGLVEFLNQESGLKGLSGRTGDMRVLQQAAENGDAAARLAIEVFVHQLAKGVGAMATSLRQFDALIFTGGIGENSPSIRSAALDRLGVFGFGRAHGPEVLVIPTNEELMIARECVRILR